MLSYTTKCYSWIRTIADFLNMIVETNMKRSSYRTACRIMAIVFMHRNHSYIYIYSCENNATCNYGISIGWATSHCWKYNTKTLINKQIQKLENPKWLFWISHYCWGKYIDHNLILFLASPTIFISRFPQIWLTQVHNKSLCWPLIQNSGRA